MGPGVQLVAVYAGLTDPSRADEWPALLLAEAALRAQYVRAEEAAEGGSDGDGDGVVGGADELPVLALAEALAEEYVPLGGHVAVGGYAARAFDPASGGCARLQVVSSSTFAEEEEAVRRIATRMGYRVQTTTDDPKVPTDRRLRRMAVHVVRPGGGREVVLYVYNSAGYELIPFAAAKTGGRRGRGGRPPRHHKKKGKDGDGGRRDKPRGDRARRDKPRGDTGAWSGPIGPPPPGAPIGSFFAVMRFSLVEAWTMRLLRAMGKLTSQAAGRALANLLGDYRRTAAAYVAARDRGDFAAVFPSEFVGCFVDPVLCDKRQHFRAYALAKKTPGKQAFFPPYLPAREARLAIAAP